jgi:hypothetical protein
MSRRAFVFLHSGGAESGKYIGPRLVTPSPSTGTRVVFIEHGTQVRGRVRNIQPSDWNPHSELTPMVHIMQDEPDVPKKNTLG